MELKPGYKMTEVGVIPEDWECLPLGDCAAIFRGGSPRPIEAYLTKAKGGCNWIKIGDVQPAAKYITQTEEKIIKEGVARSRVVHRGDFLLSNSMSFGRPYILQIDGCIHDGWLVIQDYQQFFNTDFLYYLLCSEEIAKQYRIKAAGSGVLNLNKELVSSVTVFSPPSAEQHAIAAALSDVDALLASLDALIAKKRDMKQAAMQELLTGRRRLGGFEGEWHSISIGDSKYSDIDREYLASNTDPNYLFFYITLENVDNGKLLNTIYCKYETSPSRARKIPHHNDILFGMVRPNLHSHLFIDKNIKDTVCSTGFCVISCKQEYLIPLFLYYKLFSTEIDIQINQIITGSNYPAISSADVKKLKTTIPPTIAEQTAIAAVLSDMDAEIAALEARRAKTQALKQGMMQELLTGRIRLRPAEGESHA